MNKIIFFCQASGDIVHILQVAHNEHEKDSNSQIVILCMFEKLLESWRFLNINYIKVVYCQRLYAPISKPWTYFVWKNKVDKLLNNLIFNGADKISKIYFTSIYDDPATAYYIHLIIKSGIKVIYLNHYDDKQSITPLKKMSIVNRLKICMYRLLTGIKFQLYNMPGRWKVIRFPKEKYKLTEIDALLEPQIFKSYAFSINNDKKNILLFSQPNRDHDLISDEEYDDIFYQVVIKLKELGYYIVQKGHPIIGTCKRIDDIVDLTIPSSIPSELVDYDSFIGCYGFLTIALASAAKMGITSYSFLPLTKNHDTEAYKGAINFTNSTSDNKIIFIQDLKDCPPSNNHS